MQAKIHNVNFELKQFNEKRKLLYGKINCRIYFE